MSTTLVEVEIRPRWWVPLPALLLGSGSVVFGAWRGGFIGWLVVVPGAVILAMVLRELGRRGPRLVVSEEGIRWPGVHVSWSEVESIDEVTSRVGLGRARFLAIRAVSRRLGRRNMINIRGLERTPDEVLELVERFSGQSVDRAR